MKYKEISVFTTEAGLDAVCARFSMLGMEQLEIVQGREEIADFLQKSAKYWDFADMDELCAAEPCVKAYIDDDDAADAAVAALKASLAELKGMALGFGVGSLNMLVQTVDDSVWLNAWKEAYKPFPVGKHLLVRPSWEDEYDAQGRRVLSLDPGMAFGTGTHETTFMCMEQLEKYVTPGCRAIDVGCGSGILGLAAAKLGAADVLAIDLDELAVKVAAENTEKNGLSNVVRVAHGDLLEKREEKADVIVANIIADVICYLCGPVKKHLLEGGTFICSGIIREREEDVQRALAAAGYTVCNRLAKGEWVCLAAKLAA